MPLKDVLQDFLLGRMQLKDVLEDLLFGRMQLRDVARRLLLAGNELGGDLVHTLPHAGETERYRLEVLLIRREGDSLDIRCGRRRQPAKRLPSQSCNDTDAKDDQEPG